MLAVKKKMLKQLAARIFYRNSNPSDLQQYLDRYYDHMLDIIDSKLYRPKTPKPKPPSQNMCVASFQNKAVVYIKLSKIRTQPGIIAQLPRELENKEYYQFEAKILSIRYMLRISLTLNTDSCECEHSPFIDPHHKHYYR